jgi:anti-sigma factor RsiW
MAGIPTINEFDLLAYADGRLDGDPVRKDEWEARIRLLSEDEQARIAAWCAQTAALRARYEWRVHEPVPQYLIDTIERRSEPQIRTPTRYAAVLSLIVAAASIGWLLGNDRRNADALAQLFSDDSIAAFSGASTAIGETLPVRLPGNVQPLDWNIDVASMRVPVPDLTENRFSLVGRSFSGIGENRAIRLDYSSESGESFSLFLRPRWQDGDTKLHGAERDGVSLTYWLDGALASAVVSQLSPERTKEIVGFVHEAMRAHNPNSELDNTLPATDPAGAEQQTVSTIEPQNPLVLTEPSVSRIGGRDIPRITN